MDLLLVDPPRVYWGFGGGLGFFSQPVGLVTLAAYLEQGGYDVQVMDCNALGIDWDTLADEIRRRQPRCVGVSSSMTCYVPDSFRCLEIVKQIDSNIITIGGGLQFTLTPAEAFLKCADLDVIVRGDGELTCLALLDEVLKGEGNLDRIKGISYRVEEEIVHNPDRAPIEALDILPLPAWHSLPMDSYRLPVLPQNWGNYAIVVTSRGCPYQCTFCSPRIGQRPYRAHSAERVLQMLDALYHEHDVRVFWFSDLSFNVDSARTEQILDGILAREWKVRIALDGTRTDLLLRDQHLLPKMKKAGVFLICLGVESYFDRELEEYEKGTTLANAERAVGLLKEHGIHSWTFFMTGNPGHDEGDVLRILDYAKRLDPTIAIFTLVTPIPGTHYYKELKAKDFIIEDDWARYDMAHPVMRTPHLNGQKLLDLIDRCYSEFYKRPGKILRHGFFGDEFERYTYRFLRFVGAAREIKEGKL